MPLVINSLESGHTHMYIYTHTYTSKDIHTQISI